MPKMSKCPKGNPTKEERTEPHSRKRKAEVAIFLQDPGENLEMEPIEMSMEPQVMEQQVMGQQADQSYDLWQRNNRLVRRAARPSWAPGAVGAPQYASLRFRWSSFSPLPPLSWADPDDVWKNMLLKDAVYVRDKNIFQRHPEIEERMRTMLLDWLMEVAELHKLHRETYYLAQDFFDRFLATQENVIKYKLQLIGVTCLFLAAKIEEIHPPRLHELSYCADDSCTESEMMKMELIIMKALNWCLTPITVVSWLDIYLQVAYSNELQHFLLPQYPHTTYLKTMELLDLVTLDVRSLEYSYRILAASALFHCTNCGYLQELTGCTWADLWKCIHFLLPFAAAINDAGKSTKLKFFPEVDVAEMHTIQTYRDRAELLRNARSIGKMMEGLEMMKGEGPSFRALTPPQTTEKP